MGRTRIKICGITSREDAEQAVLAGTDAIGLNFYRESARFVSPETAAGIVNSIAPYVQTVGLFVDMPPEQVAAILDQVPLGMLQFHGNESPVYCEAFGRPYVKALKATTAEDIASQAERYSSAAGLLIDSVALGQFGGTGKVFDWNLIPALKKPLILAGGLNPENVAEAVGQVQPYSVDVSGGVEKRKGMKDVKLMIEFVMAVQLADRSV